MNVWIPKSTAAISASSEGLSQLICLFGQRPVILFQRTVSASSKFGIELKMIISKLQSKLAFFGLLLVSAGCGGKTDLEPVSGQVVYKSKPVEGAQVIFQSDKVARPGMGSTDADGKFQLSTFEFRDGAAVGSYVVTVVKQDTSAAASNPFQTMDEKMKQDPSLTTKMSQELGKKMGGPPVAAKDALPAKYGDPKKSPLKAEVKKSATNQFVFELTD